MSISNSTVSVLPSALLSEAKTSENSSRRAFMSFFADSGTGPMVTSFRILGVPDRGWVTIASTAAILTSGRLLLTSIGLFDGFNTLMSPVCTPAEK